MFWANKARTLNMR
uniref:Uncharacterized protein n=1 Tax=Arundo donax TaxID=35708 RepID=A0A0A9FHQ3_ARUDO